MNVFVITTDEPFYLPKMLLDLLFRDKHGRIKGIVLLSPVRKNQSFMGLVKEFWGLYDPKTFLITGMLFVFHKAARKLPSRLAPKRLSSVRDAAHRFDLPVYTPKNINAAEWLEWFASLQPDVILSLSASQILGSKLLSLPTYGAINVHGGPLPFYRGLMPSFWMLLNGEKEAGVTVHWIEKGIDTGPILLQERFQILPADTQHTLILRSKQISARLAMQALDLVEKEGKNAPTTPNPADLGSYFGAPTAEDARRFLRQGRRFR